MAVFRIKERHQANTGGKNSKTRKKKKRFLVLYYYGKSYLQTKLKRYSAGFTGRGEFCAPSHPSPPIRLLTTILQDLRAAQKQRPSQPFSPTDATTASGKFYIGSSLVPIDSYVHSIIARRLPISILPTQLLELVFGN